MTFSEALEELKSGKKIKRESWEGYWVIDSVCSNVGEEQDDFYTGNYVWNQIIAKLKEGGYAPAMPYQADLLANDWEVVE
jgi:hypothetical protein